MKSVITTICVLIPLVILFIIIDRKDFHSGDDVVVQQNTVTGMKPTTVTTLKPVERPTDTKAVEMKPVAETNPVAENNPMEAKPTETKQAETKPVETKPAPKTMPATATSAETKPVAKIKPAEMKPVAENKPAPVAIPVVAAEEAEKRNEEAIQFSKTSRLSLTRVDDSQTEKNEAISTPSEVVVEGIVKNVSTLTDPKESDYPNCYYMTEFEVKRIISGTMTSALINLSIPGFKDYKLTSFRLKVGDKIRCHIISEEFASKEEKDTQVCDNFNHYDWDTYFLHSYKNIREWSGNLLPQFASKEKYQSAWDRCFNPPQTEQSIQKRQKAILDELKYLDNIYTEQIDEKELQERWNEDRASLPEIKPDFFWFQKGESVYALPKELKHYANPDVSTHVISSSIPAIVALKDYLKSQNVDLILVLYPDLYSVAIRAFYENTKNAPIEPSTKIAKEFLKNDVEVIDLGPRLLPLLDSVDFMFYYYHLNGHPGWKAQEIAGKLVAERLQRYGIPASLDPLLFSEKEVLALDENYLYPEGLPIGNGKAGEPIKTKAIYYNGKATVTNPNSSVSLWGNSFLAWPKNWAFVTSVAKYHLNFCEIQWGAGCFTTMIRDLLISPEEYVKNKKVLVMPIAVSMLNDRKIWNIRDMEKKLKKDNNLTKRFSVALPSGDIEESDISNLAQNAGVEGKCYVVGKDGLILGLPEIEIKPDSSYEIEISYYNNYSLSLSYRGKRTMIPAPAQFVIETMNIPYAQGSTIIFNAPGQNRKIFIHKIEICEYKNDE